MLGGPFEYSCNGFRSRTSLDSSIPSDYTHLPSDLSSSTLDTHCLTTPTYQVLNHLPDPGLDTLNALPGALQCDLVRVGTRAWEADDDPTILLRYLVDQLWSGWEQELIIFSYSHIPYTFNSSSYQPICNSTPPHLSHFSPPPPMFQCLHPIPSLPCSFTTLLTHPFTITPLWCLGALGSPDIGWLAGWLACLPPSPEGGGWLACQFVISLSTPLPVYWTGGCFIPS